MSWDHGWCSRDTNTTGDAFVDRKSANNGSSRRSEGHPSQQCITLHTVQTNAHTYNTQMTARQTARSLSYMIIVDKIHHTHTVSPILVFARNAASI